MIDVAVIASLPHLSDLAARGSIGMALTHLALRHPSYAAHYAAQAATGLMVILDNSAYELEETTGSGMAAEPVMKAAHLTGAEEVVCTDVPYCGEATITATRHFLDEAANLGDGIRFMAVPQGSTRVEWLSCYEQLAAMPGIAAIGLSKLSVPRCWRADVATARLACVAELHRHGPPPRPLHLLGGDHSLAAELRAHRERGHLAVRSNDSSTAYWYAALAIPLNPRTGRAAALVSSKPELERTRLTAGQLAVAHTNITVIRGAAGLPPEPPAQAGKPPA